MSAVAMVLATQDKYNTEYGVCHEYVEAGASTLFRANLIWLGNLFHSMGAVV